MKFTHYESFTLLMEVDVTILVSSSKAKFLVCPITRSRVPWIDKHFKTNNIWKSQCSRLHLNQWVIWSHKEATQTLMFWILLSTLLRLHKKLGQHQAWLSAYLVPVSNGMMSVWVGGLLKSRGPEWLQFTMPVAGKLPISGRRDRWGYHQSKPQPSHITCHPYSLHSSHTLSSNISNYSKR